MRLLPATVLLLTTQCALVAQERFYGSIAVAAYSPTKATSGISVSFAKGVLDILREQNMVKAVGEVRVLTGEPTEPVVINVLSESSANTLAIIRIESGNDERATFSIEVVQRAERKGIIRKIATVGSVVAARVAELSRGIAKTLVSFASRFKEVRVFLYVLTTPPECDIIVGGSDRITSRADGIGIFDGTRPVGSTTVSVMKAGYDAAKFEFDVPAAFEGPYLRMDRRVELKRANTP